MAEQEAVSIGSWVKITGFEPDEEETYHVVDDSAARPAEFRIGESAPLARALLGKQVGDKVPYQTPAGEVELTIVDVGEA